MIGDDVIIIRHTGFGKAFLPSDTINPSAGRFYPFACLIYDVLLLFYGKDVFKDMEFWFVLIMLVVALGINWCCNETGSRADHGNFAWQVISVMWFVYYYMLKTVLTGGDALREGKVFALPRNKVNRCFLALYGIYVLKGVLYLVKYMVTKDMA